jgi:hypothetical protein
MRQSQQSPTPELSALGDLIQHLDALVVRMEKVLDNSKDDRLERRLSEMIDAILASNHHAQQIAAELKSLMEQQRSTQAMEQRITLMAQQMQELHQNQIQMNRWLGEALDPDHEEA